MKFLKNLLKGNTKRESEMPVEVARVFERVKQLLLDESQQNAMNHPSIAERITGGLDVDQLPNATGEFGHCIENPIPVNGPLGEILYLSQLQSSDTNQRLFFHRIGSALHIDIYETVTTNGKLWDLLYLSLYHPRKSRIAPEGYRLVSLESQPAIFGVNSRIEEFPIGLQRAVIELTKSIFGIPLASSEIRIAEESCRFDRPVEHQRCVREAMSIITGSTI